MNLPWPSPHNQLAVEERPPSHVLSQFSRFAHRGWFTAVWALAALSLGVLLVSRPAPTALFLVSFMALLWLTGGIIDILSVVLGRAGQRGRLRLWGGLAAIIAALIILVGDPFAGAALVVRVQFYLVALAAVVNGVINIVDGIRGLDGWGRVVIGLVQLTIGGLFVFNQVDALLSLVFAIGMVLAVGGMFTLSTTLVARLRAEGDLQNPVPAP